MLAKQSRMKLLNLRMLKFFSMTTKCEIIGDQSYKMWLRNDQNFVKFLKTSLAEIKVILIGFSSSNDDPLIRKIDIFRRFEAILASILPSNGLH